MSHRMRTLPAKKVLAHYITHLMMTTGHNLDLDWQREIEAAVDNIVEVAVEEAVDQTKKEMARRLAEELRRVPI